MNEEQQPPPSTAQELHEAGYAEMDSLTSHPFAPLDISGSISRKPIRKPVGAASAFPISVQGLPLHEAMGSLTTNPKAPIYQAYHPQSSVGAEVTQIHAAAPTTVPSQQYEAYNPASTPQETQPAHHGPTRSSSTVSTQSYQGGQYNRQSGGYTAYQAYQPPAAPSSSQNGTPVSSTVSTALYPVPTSYPRDTRPISSQISNPPSQVSTPDTIKSRLSSTSYKAYPVPDHYLHQVENSPTMPASSASLHQVYEMGDNGTFSDVGASTYRQTSVLSPPPLDEPSALPKTQGPPPPPAGPPPGHRTGQLQQQPVAEAGLEAPISSQPAEPVPDFQQGNIPAVAPLSIRRPVPSSNLHNSGQLHQTFPGDSTATSQQDILPPAPAQTPPTIQPSPANLQRASQPPPPPVGSPTQYALEQPPPPAGSPPSVPPGNSTPITDQLPDARNGLQVSQPLGIAVDVPQRLPLGSIYASTPASSALSPSSIDSPFQQPLSPTSIASPPIHHSLPTATPPPTYQQAQQHQVSIGGLSSTLQHTYLQPENQQTGQVYAQRPIQAPIQVQTQPLHQGHVGQPISAVASPYQYPQAQSVPVPPQGVVSPTDYFGTPLHHSQSMGALPSNCPNICAGCKSGIPYFTQFSSCDVCSIFLCVNCVPHHMPAHQTSMVRLTSQQTLANGYRDPRNCGLCRKAIHVRYDCRQCQYSICVDCWDSAEGRRHPHAEYIVIEPPGKAAVLQYAAAECRECVFRTTLGHCDLCLLAIGSNDIAMECATCELTFDRSINLCRKCHSETSHLHDKSHRWISLGAHLCTAEAQQAGVFGCRECGWRSNDFKTTLSQHGHTNLVLFLGPAVLQIMLPVIYKTCMRKPQRLDAPLSPNAPFNGRIWGCDWCRNRFPMPEAYRCRGCPDFDLCTYCYPTASHLHKHGQVAFTYLGAPTASATGIVGGMPTARGPVTAGRGGPTQRGGAVPAGRGRGRGAPAPTPVRPMSVGIKAVDQHLAKWDSNGKLKQGLVNTGKGIGSAFLALNGINVGQSRGRGHSVRPAHHQQQQQQQQAGAAGTQPVYIVGGDGGGDSGSDTTYITETTFVETDTTYGADGSVEVDTTVVDTTTVDTSSATTTSGFDWSSLVSGGDGGGTSFFGGDGGGDS